MASDDWIEFPYAPYPIQSDFMRSLYVALEHGGVALLESPTGTGKTISIICSSLQWLEDHRAHVAAQKASCQQQAAQALSAKEDPDWLQQAALQHVCMETEELGQQTTLAQRRARCHSRKKRAIPAHAVLSLAAGGPPSDACVRGKGPGTSQSTDPSKEEDLSSMMLVDEEQPTNNGRHTICYGLSSSDSEGGGAAKARQARQAHKALPQKTQVVFCSRTHSQLSQFVSELGRTGYAQRLSLVALASRRVLCINSQVASMGSANLINQTCLDMQQASVSGGKAGRKRSKGGAPAAPSGRCPYLHHEGQALEAWQDEVMSAPADVEDLLRMGRSLSVCPYYGSRSLVCEADVVLAPYAVVLQRESRQAVGLNLEGSVLIIDEAHNLVDALNNLHSHSVSGDDLAAARAMLASYWERLGARLGPRNAQHVQLLQRVLTTLGEVLRPPGADGSTGDGDGAGGVISANSFLFQHELDDINMFDLLAWVKDSKLLVKLASYSKWLSQTEPQTDNTIQKPAPTIKTSSNGTGLGGGGSSGSKTCNKGGPGKGGDAEGSGSDGAHGVQQQRTERLASLQAVVGFLSALTNSDADGRILTLYPKQGTQEIGHMREGAEQQCPGRGRGNAGRDGRAGRGGGHLQVKEKVQASVATSEQASGCLKYILLSAASHFGKVLSSCRAVVLASGTLAPVEGLAAQLFTTSGLKLANTPTIPTHQQHTELAPAGPSSGSGTAVVTKDAATKLTTIDHTTIDAPYHPARLLATLDCPTPSAGSFSQPALLGTCTAPKHTGGSHDTQGGEQAHCPCPTADICGRDGSAGEQRGVGGGHGLDGPCAIAGDGSCGGSLAPEASSPSSSERVRPLLHYACGHVVPADHVAVLVAGSGPTGLPLDMRHAQRSTPNVMDEVGRLLLNVSRVVPGGMVVFVPSFVYLAQLTQQWQRTGLMDTLAKRKAVFIEPRSAAEVELVLQRYAAAATGTGPTQGEEKLRDSTGRNGGSDGSGSGSGAAGRVAGAVLLAVVGGKLSEGINFGDDLGRCVVVLGLPYANPSCPELRERQAYLDRAAHQATASGGKERTKLSSTTPATLKHATAGTGGQPKDSVGAAVEGPAVGLTGRQLYENMCMNAVNQCVGRVVRHRHDHAVVLLVDARYVRPGLSSADPGARKASSSSQPHAPAAGGSPTDSLAMYFASGAPVSKLPKWMHASLDTERVEFPAVYGKIVQFFKKRNAAI